MSTAYLETPEPWLDTAYQRAADDNVLRSLDPSVFFGYWSVCADRQGFGQAYTYPSLDGHQLSHALLFLGRQAEVRANWDFVRRYQRADGKLPIRVDDRGEGLYTHWVPGDPLGALGATTYAHNAFAIYAHTLDDDWLVSNLASINLSAAYLASLVSPQARVGGSGYYVEMPTRIAWDGVTQCYAVDALLRTARLNLAAGELGQARRWGALARSIRRNFRREFWQDGHCVEYIHPVHGPVNWHGLTDVDWAAVAVGMLPKETTLALWRRLRNAQSFWYGGMPTGISTQPDTYEDWEFVTRDQIDDEAWPAHMPRRHDLAAMGRVWYLEAWARTRMGDVKGLLESLRAVARVGEANGYSWRERYYPSDAGPCPGGPATYCEYPANLVRIVNQFLFGVEPPTRERVTLRPQLPRAWWRQGFAFRTHLGEATLALHAQDDRVHLRIVDAPNRTLQLLAPPGLAWQHSGTCQASSRLVAPASAHGDIAIDTILVPHTTKGCHREA